MEKQGEEIAPHPKKKMMRTKIVAMKPVMMDERVFYNKPVHF